MEPQPSRAEEAGIVDQQDAALEKMRDRGEDEPVTPPAPANQWTPHDGGIAPAAPAPNAASRALRRITSSLGRLFGRRNDAS